MLPLLLKNALGSASRYVVSHPMTVLQVARHAALLRWAIPLDALRWLVRQIPAGRSTPTDIRIEARPPAIYIGATVDLMGAVVRVAGSLRFDQVRISPEAALLAVHVSDLAVIPEDPNSPLNQLLQSGAINLEKPADLLGFMGRRPSVIVSAKGKDFELDLLQIPGMGDSPLLLRGLGAVTPVVNLRAIETRDDFLIVGFQATPSGLPAALAALRGQS
jgi:hypothetical protein